jgi:membrane associated rhomboid family serine protease
VGVHNRDYMRSGDGRRAFWMPGRVTWWLIGINVLLWFIYASAWNAGTGRGPFRPVEPSGVGGFIAQQLVLHTQDVFGSLKLWQLGTAFWLHDPSGIEHVFWNMLLLFFFGRTVEATLGSRRFLWLYLGGGLASTLVCTGFAYVTGVNAAVLGASGCVYAVLVWLALREPRRTIWIMFVIPVPLWVAVGVFMVGGEVVSLVALRTGGLSSVGHLAGAAWGWFFFRRFVQYGAIAAAGPGAWLVKIKGERTRARAAETEQRAAAVKADVDLLLAKIHAEGIGALTEAEKAFLQQASQRYK